MYIRKVIDAAGGACVKPTDPAFEKAYPALWEYCTAGTHEDGTERPLSKMSLNVVEGRWSVYFADAATKSGFFLSGTTFQELLKSLEKHLAAGTAEWRRMPDWAKKRGKGA